MDELLPYLHKEQVISLESTTYLGTTGEELLPRIESIGLKVGKEFFLVSSQESEDPGHLDFVTWMIRKVCGGMIKRCREVGFGLYNQVIDKVIQFSSTKTVEITKLLENIHRSINIGLVNEMKRVADKMGIDIREVIDAAAIKPFSFVPCHPDPGLGWHCILIDPSYLTWKERS
jgi:UDP-N-acetyl-D-glucosamine dehydrogenase